MGRVKRTKQSSGAVSGRILKNSRGNNGYFFVGLYKKGKRNNFSVHRLVVIAFLKNTKAKPCVNHKNGIRRDNRLSNLEWCTHMENMSHAIKVLNTIKRGNDSPNSKLKSKQVKEIKKLIKNNIQLKTIARIFKIDPRTISSINTKRTWKNI